MSRVAAVQMNSGGDVDANLAAAGRLIAAAAAAGARVAVLPENFSLMARSREDRRRAAEDESGGPTQSYLRAQARRHSIWLIAGSIPYKSAAGARVRSACLVFDDDGTLVARYDKMHLFDVHLGADEVYEESAYVEPGDELVCADTPCGRVGLSICYDVRFPEMFRRLLDDGAEWFVVPSAFTVATGRAHWEVLLRARAIENLAYVVAPAQSGTHDNGRETYGDSMIVDPWGEVLARRPRGEGIVTAEIDLERAARARASLPALEHRRLGIRPEPVRRASVGGDQNP